MISKNRSDTAKFGAVIGFLHFFKRELESEFVHIFSNVSVPVSGSFKNFFHYWVLYGLLVVGEIFFFKTKSSDWPRKYYWIFTALIAFFEFMNYKCHCVLRDLRLDSSGKVDPHKRGIPRGFGFDSALCANYTWEILTWITYTIMTKSWMSTIRLTKAPSLQASEPSPCRPGLRRRRGCFSMPSRKTPPLQGRLQNKQFYFQVFSNAS